MSASCVTKIALNQKPERRKIMHLNFIAIGIISGLILTLLVGIFCYTAYDNEHWIAKTIISGLIMTTISVYAGTIDNTNTNIEKSIKNTITSNYDNVLNYHNDKDNKYFVSGNSKYTFDYDKDTKTLIVYTNSKVDAIFIDDVKQKTNH